MCIRDSYSTAEDFERNNLRYSLTRRGEAALEGITRAAAVLEATGAWWPTVCSRAATSPRVNHVSSRSLAAPNAHSTAVFSSARSVVANRNSSTGSRG